MANVVNIPMQGVSRNQILADVRKKRTKILEDHFRGLVKDRMQARLSDTNHGTCRCGRYIRHIKSDFCQKYLRMEMMKGLRRAYKERLITLPDEIKNSLRAASAHITLEFLESISCRTPGCYSVVDKWPHIGFCSTHIHTEEAIETIKLRYEIFQSDIVFPDLKRIILAYI